MSGPHALWRVAPVRTPDGTEWVAECVCGEQSRPQLDRERAVEEINDHASQEEVDPLNPHGYNEVGDH